MGQVLVRNGRWRRFGSALGSRVHPPDHALHRTELHESIDSLTSLRPSHPSPDRLAFEGVSKSYGAHHDASPAVQALTDVDLQVAHGTSIGVIGPNGAGKSTLLRLAMGVTTPDRGRIVRRGRTAGVLELSLGLHPELTGLENLYFAGALLGMSRREVQQRRPALIEFSGLGGHIGRPVKHYSSGMLARLGFSIATHADAELLLIDEVLAVGDLEFRQRSLEVLQERHRAGTSIVAVTHDLAMMTQLCERAILLVDGRIEADGPAAAVAARYLGVADDPASRYGSVALRGRSTEVVAGRPWRFDAEIEVEDAHPHLAVHLALGLPNSSIGLEGDGVQFYASTPLAVDVARAGKHRFTLEVDTTFLPAGSFLVRLSVVRPDRIDPITDTVTARVEAGRSTAMRLDLPATLAVAPPTVPAR